jgi:ATP-dependent helicase/nuclease subunit A
LSDLHFSDLSQRREAILAEGHAFVWASAGTGKTHTLTLRALYLLINAPFLPSTRTFAGLSGLYSADEPSRLRAARTAIHSLVLTTFTRKASAEMQTRLYELLDSLASARDWTEIQDRYAETNPLLIELCRIVEGNIRRSTSQEVSFLRLQAGVRALADFAPELQISTLHSFATDILRRNPLFSGIGPGIRFAREDEDDFEEVPAQVVRRWWRQEAVEGSKLEKDLSRVLEVASLDQVQNWLTIVCQHPWISDRMLFNEEVCSAAGQARLLSACELLSESLEKHKTSAVSRNRENLKAALRRIQAGGESAWSRFYAFALSKDAQKLFLDIKETPVCVRDSIAGLPGELSLFFHDRPRFQATLAACALSLDHRENWEAWKRVVQNFASWSRQAAIRELGIVTFDAMIENAVLLLEENAAVRRSEGARLRALLVDEFQDTDDQQLRLLKAILTRDPETGHEPLGFFVGDRKQSIYRFRGADPPAVDDFCCRYASLTQGRLDKQEYQLSTTFRCQPSIARFVNHFFTEEIELAAPPEWLRSKQPDEEGPAEWRCIEPPVSSGRLPAGRIRAMVAGQIVRLIEEYREVDHHRLSDILILVRTFADLDVVLPVLQRAGIPVVSSGARTFYRQPEVLDVLNLLVALLNPLDSLATATVLRSPCLGLSDPEIYGLFKSLPAARVFHGTTQLPESLSEPSKLRILQMRSIVEQRRTLDLPDWLRSIRSLLPLHLYVRESDKEGRALYRIGRVFERFQRELEEGTGAPLPWLLNQRLKVSKMRDWGGPHLGEDVSIADETVEAVRIMTIHKAKGLEGRFVIVYNWMEILEDTERGKNKANVLSFTGEDGTPVREFCLDWGPFAVSSPAFHEARKANESLERKEAVRVAYVAATRARSRLTLVCPPVKRGPEQVSALIESMRSASLPGLDDRRSADHEKGFRFVFVPAIDVAGREQPPESPWSSAKKGDYRRLWQDRLDNLRKPAAMLLESPSRSGEQAEHPPSEVLLEAGRLVHSYLERHLLESDFEPLQLQILAGRESDHSPEALSISSSALSRFYSETGRYRERLRSSRVLAQEVPFFLYFEERSWNGVIDLILEEDGIVRGVDFKLSAEANPLPASYARQKRVYSEAICRLFRGRTVDFDFWWLG